MSNINETTVDWSWKEADSYATVFSVFSGLCSAVTLILIVTNRIKTTVKLKKYALAGQVLALLGHLFYYLLAYHNWDDGIENGRNYQIIYGLMNFTGKFQLKLVLTNLLIISLMNTEVLGTFNI
jgi:hypothetical protein